MVKSFGFSIMVATFNEEHVIYRYKYLPFSEGALKTLLDGTIKFTCPLDFNDPFDCLPYYDKYSIEQYARSRPDLLKAAGDLRGLSPSQRLQQKGQFVARLRNRVADGSFAADLLRRVGVVSLSRDALSILMWSHYADFHRGFVLEFRIPTMGTHEDLRLSTSRLLPFPVEYSAERPHIKIGTELPRDLVPKIVLTKSLDWEYEAEERVVDQERGAGIFTYSRDDILCSVIAGMRMPSRDYEHLESIVVVLAKGAIPHLKLFRASAKRDEYRLEVAEHPRLAVV
jgi:hypothetical protein